MMHFVETLHLYTPTSLVSTQTNLNTINYLHVLEFTNLSHINQYNALLAISLQKFWKFARKKLNYFSNPLSPTVTLLPTHPQSHTKQSYP